MHKFLSPLGLLLVLCAGWVGLSYIRTELRGHPETTQGAAVSSPLQPVSRPVTTQSIQQRRLSAPIKLVYSCPRDNEFFHVSTHVPPRCERTAMSEEAALHRGLKPCPICFPVK
jgi:hypothetical protein